MAVRTYIIETEFAKIDNPQSATTYIVLDDNDPTSVNKVVFKTNNINKEGEIYTVQNGQPAPEPKTCKFKFNSDGKFQFIKNGIGSYYLKVNDGEWTEYTDSQIVDVVTGDVIELKSDVKQYLRNSAITFNDYPNPIFTPAAVSWELEGDLIGTLYGEVFPIYGCYGIFKNCSGLTKVPNDLFANFEYVPSSGCQDMFRGCTSLTTAPALPATTLGSYSYSGMFQRCTSLTSAPALPATSVASYSYSNMFNGCTSLTTAPELPATTLSEYSYSSMFEGCTSLTTVPSLSATALDQYSCNKMFYGCTSLTTAPDLPATSLVGNSYSDMFHGCTSLTTAPVISATSVQSYSCSSMFEGCTSLTTAPTLLSTSIASNSYRKMFSGCTNLNYVKCLATSGISTTSLNSWLSGVSATGTFVKAASASYSTGTSGIPSGWTIEDAA